MNTGAVKFTANWPWESEMVKTKIEWCDYTINPVKGKCPMACSYCYARRMYDRFGWNPVLRYEDEDHWHFPVGDKVFVGSTMELFGDWINPAWLITILGKAKAHTENNFIFLTKLPHNLIEWSPFPDNCWIGVSATNEIMTAAGCAWLGKIQAKVKFLSLEPLLSWDRNNADNSILKWHPEIINWVIIGQQK